ncbi:hypothetical protein CEB3_c42820 [Peptococcaceae bacterium CEB3]|nr:hypothetical protein CEB3_c42820 [Peptococcaceae bacterium CEB3]
MTLWLQLAVLAGLWLGVLLLPAARSLALAQMTGGSAVFLVALVLILSGFKFAYLELASGSKAAHARSRGNKVFLFMHKALGWLILLPAGYHSAYYVYYYWQIIHSTALPVTLTGVFSLLATLLILSSGRALSLQTRPHEPSYKWHIGGLVCFIVILLIHLNVR